MVSWSLILGLVFSALALKHPMLDKRANATILSDSGVKGLLAREHHVVQSFSAANSTAVTAVHIRPTFSRWYDAYTSGPGIWKWSNALIAYERHFGMWAGLPLKLAEIGVQSGGSVDMWHAVLGAGCHVYGIDINPQANKFIDQLTSIVIGDQASPQLWQHFFSTQTPALDILIDDGGHEPHQMLTTLNSAWPHINPGGYVAIEDIHGPRYLESFFAPAANYLTESNQLQSVHIYPFVLIVQKAGDPASLPKSRLSFIGSYVTVDNFDDMWARVAQSPGGTVILENPGWGDFLTAQGLLNFFKLFNMLHDSRFQDFPAGCQHTSAPVCTNTVQVTPMQGKVTGVHIYRNRLVIETSRSPIVIAAIRKGTEWLNYR